MLGVQSSSGIREIEGRCPPPRRAWASPACGLHCREPGDRGRRALARACPGKDSATGASALSSHCCPGCLPVLNLPVSYLYLETPSLPCPLSCLPLLLLLVTSCASNSTPELPLFPNPSHFVVCH